MSKRFPALLGALAALTLTAACAQPAPAGDPKSLCGSVLQARKTAHDALAPVAVTLAKEAPSHGDIAKATDDLKATFTAMHTDVAGAAQQTTDTRLKDTLAAYQLSIEEAIVVVEGADGDKAKLASAITLPALQTAEQAVIAACA